MLFLLGWMLILICDRINGVTVLSTPSDIPNFIKICHKLDPNLNECVKDSIESLRPRLSKGIPELSIPACEPLDIPKISLTQSAGPITLKSEYTNIKIYGPSRFQLKGIKVDPVKDTFRLKLWFPELQMKSNYKIQGKILMMPLRGAGICSGNYTDVDAIAGLRGERFFKNGEEHLRVKDLFVEFNIGGATVQLDDLFNGDMELGKAMNRFLNENWRIVAAELRPALEDAIGSELQGIANKVFDAYPIKNLLPD